MSKFFSPTTNAFYASEFRTSYDAAGTWPADAVAVSDDIWQQFIAKPPDGQTRGVVDGMPAWVDIAPPTPAQLAATALADHLAAGIALTCTGNSALDATYALDEVSAAQIYQLGLFASQFATFPGGPAQPYPDATGVPHVFDVAQFVAFLRVVAPLVSALNTQAQVMAHGGQPVWPAQSAVIA